MRFRSVPSPPETWRAGHPDLHSRTVLVILVITVFSVMLAYGIILPILPAFASSLGATGLWIGIIVSGFSFARVILMPVLGRVSDRYDRRVLILGGLVLDSVFSLLFLVIDSVSSLAVIRFMQGIASAMVVPIAMAYFADNSPVGKEGRHMAAFALAFLLGMGLGPVIGGMVHDQYGTPAVFILMAALSGISFFLCFILPPSRSERELLPPVRDILQYTHLWAALFFQLMFAFGTATIIAFLPFLMTDKGVSSSGTIGLALSVMLVTMAILQQPFGKYADRYDKRLLITGGLVLVSGGLALYPFLTDSWQFIGNALLIGIAGGISIPAALIYATVAGREIGQGAAMGTFMMSIGVGTICGALFSGVVYDHLGISPVFFIAATICLFSIPVILLLAGKQRNSPDSGEGAED
jgi:MFS transporter, DHA1 family, multidrug resistance protein